MNYARLMQTQLGARAHETAEEKAVICLANVYVIKEVRLHQISAWEIPTAGLTHRC